MDMQSRAAILTRLDEFVENTREVVYLRRADRILIIRPNKIQHVNETAFEMLYALYHQGQPPDDVVQQLAGRYQVPERRLLHDLAALLESLQAIMKEEYARAPLISTIPFDQNSIQFPVLSEIAVTYRCQNRCDFCYASSPYRGREVEEMKTAEIRQVIDKICDEAQVPTISFTGGEPTLREDLPEMIAHARSRGMRTNLITNGIRCADEKYVDELAAAGLNSSQVSLEAHEAGLHDRITGNAGSFDKTVRGIHRLKDAGIHTHTNTTISRLNKNHLPPLVRYVKETFDFPYLSMNMIIRTGIARDNENVEISYSAITGILRPVLDLCERLGIRFVWYSPTPYCIFNPVDHNLGSKSCACVSGLVSVNPAGDVLPCSSFGQGVGNLLKESFARIWNSDEAMYWRERRYAPPVCRSCEYEKVCGGACPLYWEHTGSFEEIERVRGCRPRWRNLWWKMEKSVRLHSRGVEGVKNNGR
jgi:radical SAM protein with 4Fe4S-binding SPASM domain